MPIPNSACCAAFLNQQQENTQQYLESLEDDEQSLDEEVEPTKSQHKSCTVVEDGLVVVKRYE